MQLPEAIALIRDDDLTTKTPAVWADLGCGSGLFTRALASFLPPGSIIHAIDQSPGTLPATVGQAVEVVFTQQDFVDQPLNLPPLDGILMANSLHYVRDQPVFLQAIADGLKPGGCLLLVEYDTDSPNPWVPYPLRFQTCERLLRRTGFASVRKLRERPSRYQASGMYAALARRIA